MPGLYKVSRRADSSMTERIEHHHEPKRKPAVTSPITVVVRHHGKRPAVRRDDEGRSRGVW